MTTPNICNSIDFAVSYTGLRCGADMDDHNPSRQWYVKEPSKKEAPYYNYIRFEGRARVYLGHS